VSDPTKHQREIERARQIGTFGKIDRSPQYDGPDRATPEALLNSDNAQWIQLRTLQVEKGRLQGEIHALRNEHATQARTFEEHKQKMKADIEALSRIRNSVIAAIVASILTVLIEKLITRLT